MSEYILLKNKIPDRKKIEHENFHVSVNTLLAITKESIYQFEIDSTQCNSQIINWLEGLNFGLKEWLDVRSNLVGTTFLSTRKTKCLAILDVVKNFNFDQNYVVHPNDLSKLPCFNKSLMSLSQFEQGVQMAKDQIKFSSQSKPTAPTNASKKASFKYKLVKNLNKTPPAKIITGSSGKKVGVHHKDVHLYFRVLKGGDIQEITKLIKAKKSISEVKFTMLTEAQTFTSFQLKVKVDDIYIYRRVFQSTVSRT